jgi:cellulose synthase/poly-beta-1,6-N-acetylglucosamine synthase-like glycosyltransferase
MFWITAGLTAIAALVALPALVIAAQVIVASVPSVRSPRRPHADQITSDRSPRPAVGVLVPAHNEVLGIRDTIESISAQTSPGDRVVVVADNCTDETARVARDCGTEVVERRDVAQRGKGFALRAGLAHLGSGRPPEYVVVVDADCRLQPGCLDALVAQATTTGRPAQARYLMKPPAAPRAVDVVSALAVLVKNRVRPLAMSRFAFPCLITGSGCIFPWTALEGRSFDGGNIVEDMQLAIDLALAGSPPSYCDDAVLFAALPDRPAAFDSQRRRWEHGHLRTVASQVPRLALAFLRTGRLELAAMLIDLAVPPLSLVVALNTVLVIAGLVAVALGGGWVPAAINAAALGLLTGSVGMAWWRFARDWMPFRFLLSVPIYVLTKLPLYASFIFRRESTWIRTARGSQASSDGVSFADAKAAENPIEDVVGVNRPKHASQVL